MSIIRPISAHVTQDFDGAYYKEKPGYLGLFRGVKCGKLTSFTGATYRKDLHLAIDYGAAIGTPVKSAQSGTVIATGTDATGGVFIALRIKRSMTVQIVAFYYHLKPGSVRVRVGQRVEQNVVIALSGNSGGVSTGAHLHFALIRGAVYRTWHWLYNYGMRLDPEPFIMGKALKDVM